MNHIYRVIWNAATATWTAVAETASGHGKCKSERRRGRAALAAGLVAGGLAATAPGLQAQSVSVANGSGKTNAYVAPNGTTVVNIDTANGAGLSHNKYNNFNVNDKGVVLNNTTSAQIAWQSQLAGQVTANFNMTNAAKVILNEVVSNNRSTLAGFTEVLGGRADVILANPYGITCSGCGFINTDRVTLTTGVPYLNANGSLAGFTVNQGDILINGNGLNATAQQMLDLVARTVKLDGTINAQDLSITAGANRYDYVSRSVTGAVPGAGTTPAYAIDSSALGGMYANRIKLTATEAGVGVRMLGDAAASSDDFTLSAAGRIELQNRISAQRDVLIASTDKDAAALALTNTSITSGRNTTLAATAGGANLAGGALVAAGDLAVNAASLIDNATSATLDNNNVRSAGGTLGLAITGAAGVNGTRWQAAGNWQGVFGTLTTGAGTRFQSSGAMSATTTSGALSLGVAALQASGDLLLSSAGKLATAKDASQGVQSLNGNITLKAAQGLDNAGVITADKGGVTLRVDKAITNSGTVHAATMLDVADLSGGATQAVTNSGDLLSDGTLALKADAIQNTASGWVQANAGSTIAGASLDNAGAMLLSQQSTATDSVSLTGNLNNTGTIQSKGDATLSAQDIANARTLLASGALALQASRNVTNAGGAILQGGRALDIDAGGSIANSAAATLRASNVSLTAASGLTNDGLVSADNGVATLRVNGTITNTATGTLQASQKLDIADQLGNATESIVNTGAMVSDGTMAVRAASITNTANGVDAASGVIQAKAGSTVTAGSIVNSGLWLLSMQGGGITSLTTTGTFTNNGTLQAWEDATLSVARLVNAKNAALRAGRDLTVNLGSGAALDNSGTIQAIGTLGLSGVGAALTNAKDAKLLGDRLNFSVASIDNSGVIQGGTSATSTITLTGVFLNQATGVTTLATSAAGAGTLSAAKIDNRGALQSFGAMTLGVGSQGLTSTGDILTGDDLTIGAAGANDYTATISGTVQAGDALRVTKAAGKTATTLAIQQGETVSGKTVTVDVNTVSLAKDAVLTSSANLDVTADTLTLAGDTISTARIAAAMDGTSKGTITVRNAFTNNGLLFSKGDLDVLAQHITNTGTGGIAALKNLAVKATGGQLDLTAATPDASAGNVTNNGTIYAGGTLAVTANGTLTNTSTISSVGTMTLRANTLINNYDIVSSGAIDIVAATLRNEIPGGDTRKWGADSEHVTSQTDSYDDNGDGGNLDEFRDYKTTWTVSQYYDGGQPSHSPQILAGTAMTLAFHEGKNLAGIIWAKDSVTMQGFSADVGQPNGTDAKSKGIWDDRGNGFKLSGATFTNDSLSLETRSYTQYHTDTRKEAGWLGGAEIYDWHLCSNKGDANSKYDEGCRYNGYNTSYSSSYNNALNAGIHTALLTGSGFSLNNNGAVTNGADNSSRASANKPSSTAPKPTTTPTGATQGTLTGQSGGVGAAGGTSIIAGNAANGVNGTSFGGIDIPLPTNPNGLFVIAREPGAKYLVESNPLYMGGTATYGSDYLTKMLGYSTDEIGLRLGDASYENYLVKQQLIAQTGNVLLATYQNADTQMQALFDNASTQSKGLGLEFGRALTPEQQAGLKQDIVWMVQTVVDGKTVLAPVVYLSAATKASVTSGAVISAQDASLNLASLTNTGGTIAGGKSLVVASTGDITNTSGTIKGGNVSLTSTEGSIVNKTFSTGNGTDQFYQTTVGNTGTISSTGTLSLDAKKDITNLGASMSAGTDASLKAGGNITFDTIENRNTATTGNSNGPDGNKGITTTTTTTVQQVKSGLTVGGNLNAQAGNDITLAGTDAKVGGNADLNAGNNVNIVARENTTTSHTTSESSGFGQNNSLYGSTKVTTDSTSVRNVGSTLEVGGNANVTAKNDVTIQGSNVDVKGNGQINATNVNVLAGRNYDETHTTTERTGVLQVSASGSGSSGAEASASAASGRGSAAAAASASAEATGTGSAGLAFSSTTKTQTDTTDLRHVGSNVSFGGNATINATQDVNLQGSNVKAGGNATVNAQNVNLLAAEDRKTSTTTSTTTTVGLMASSNNKAEAEASASANAAAGKGNPNAAANASASASANSENHLDLVQHSTSTTSTLDTTHQGSSISAGGDLNVKASNNLTLEGSQLASGGNMNLEAKDMTFKAVDDVHETRSSSSTTTAGFYASGNASAETQAGAGVGLGAQAGASAEASARGEVGLYGSNTRTSNVDGSTTAVTSGISAGGNLTRTATNSITDVGTQISAGGNLTQSANTITSLAAANTTYSSSSTATDTAKVGAYAEASAGASASASAGPGAGKPAKTETSAGAGITASYQHDDASSTSNTSNAVVSNIKVGGSVNSTSTNATTLEGTTISAGKDVALNAGSLDYRAAANTSSSSSNSTSAGGKVDVDIVNKSVGVGVNYQGDKSSDSSSTAVAGGINAGGNLSINTRGDTRLEGTNVAAGGSASVTTGGNLTFDAAKNTSSSSSQSVGVEVGVTAGKGEGGASVGVGVGKASSSGNTEVAGSIASGGPLTIKSGGDATFTGTALASGGDTTVAAGGNLAFNAARDKQSSQSTTVDVSAAASGGKKENVGGTKGANGTKTGGKTMNERSGEASVGVGVQNSQSDTATAASITSGGNIKLTSGGNTTLEGTQGKAAGSIAVAAGGTVTQKDAVSTSSSTDVSVSASGSGSSLTTPTKKAGTGGSGSSGTGSSGAGTGGSAGSAGGSGTGGGTGNAGSGTGTGGTGGTGTGTAGTGGTGGTGATKPRDPYAQQKGSGVANIGVDVQSSTTSQKTSLTGGQGVTVTSGQK